MQIKEDEIDDYSDILYEQWVDECMDAGFDWTKMLPGLPLNDMGNER